jgi:hypothetical protein
LAVDRDLAAVTARVVADPRRWAAFECFGVHTLLMHIQGYHEDLTGALEADQLALAKYVARLTALLCLRTRALLADGMPEDSGDVFANLYAGVDPETVDRTLEAAGAVIRARTVAEAARAEAPLHRCIEDLVRDLGFQQTPPSIRTPAGLFPALKTTRQLLPVNKEANLPLVFPQSWVSQRQRPENR